MKSTAGYRSLSMDSETLPSFKRKSASFRNCLVSGFSTELLEVVSEEPSLNVLFIPGNPGVVSFYKEFAEALYEQLGGSASITAIGHISHAKEDLAFGRLFSLQEQINHKVDFIKELRKEHLPIILVGHSIGSYVCLDILERFPEQVGHSIGSYVCLDILERFPEQVIFYILLYPFLTVNTSSLKQSVLTVLSRSGILLAHMYVWISSRDSQNRSSLLSATISYFLALLGSFPTPISRALVSRLVGQSWSRTAVDVACSSLLKYHTVRNALFMAKSEFKELAREPDWAFMKENVKQIAFLFGDDDHWSPLSFYEEISKQVPGAALSVEREGHTHAFSCTESGSNWVAHYVTGLIRSQVPIRNESLSQ